MSRHPVWLGWVVSGLAALAPHRAMAIDPRFCAMSNLSSPPPAPTAKLLGVQAGIEQWIIALPVVKTQAFSYEQLVLRNGDKFRVSACGCVQTGGVGKTWKLFVNPSGPNSNHLYHGLVSVDPPVGGVPVKQLKLKDGASLAVVRIQDLMNAEASNPNFMLQARATESFTLGYEDDHYSDNGYWGHDDGTQNQCAKIGGAVVEIDVLRVGPATSPPPPER
jgi:hypothetical protein